MRIDHVGSTSIIGIAAKSVIDIQISVASSSPMDELATLMGEGVRRRCFENSVPLASSKPLRVRTT